MGARVHPKPDQYHLDWPEGVSRPVCVSVRVPFIEVFDFCDPVFAGLFGYKDCEFWIREGLQVGAVVEYLCHGIPRELLAFKFEHHQSTVLIDPEKIDIARTDLNLSANQRESAH